MVNKISITIRTYFLDNKLQSKLFLTKIEIFLIFRAVAEGWEGLPVTLDASFTWTNGRVYFFKGSQYWRFTTPGQLDQGYPKTLSDGFEGIPDNVDAALVWAANSKIYFFKGDTFQSESAVCIYSWDLMGS